jgi:hypothetical protein
MDSGQITLIVTAGSYVGLVLLWGIWLLTSYDNRHESRRRPSGRGRRRTKR